MTPFDNNIAGPGFNPGNILGTAGMGARSYLYPYPTFPYTTISRLRAASDFTGGTIPVDTASSGNPYGNATAPRFTIAGSGWTILQSALTSAGPVDVSAGSLRVNLKPAANTFNLSQFTLKLFSTTNVASPGANYHQIAMSSRVGQQWTGNGATSAGRWQTITAPISAATAVGTGATLTSIRHCQISGFGAAGFDLGDIEFVPNPRTKAAVIIRADDGDQSQYNVLFPKMQAAGAPFMIAPSPLSTCIDGTFKITRAQWQEMLDAGVQNLAQGYTTEDVTTIDNWTSQQRYAEWSAIPTFVRPTGHEIDTYDGSYMSSFGPKDMIAGQDFRDRFRSLCNFTGGQASGNPLPVSETFPFGDRYNITCLNLNSWGDVADIYTNHLLLALEQTRAAKGVLIIAFHNEMGAGANYTSAIDSVIDYVNNQFPSEIEFTTIRRILAPYTSPVDPVLGSTGTGTMDFSIATGDNTGLLALNEDI